MRNEEEVDKQSLRQSSDKKQIQTSTIVGNYKLEKTIGEGTFGKVKLAIHLPTQEYVAIKILEKSKIHDQEELERVEKEIKYLKKLLHPNIIQIYEVSIMCYIKRS